MNILMKQKQTHGHREQICGCQGGGAGERMVEEVAGANDYIQNGQTTRSNCIAQGIIFNIL